MGWKGREGATMSLAYGPKYLNQALALARDLPRWIGGPGAAGDGLTYNAQTKKTTNRLLEF